MPPFFPFLFSRLPSLPKVIPSNPSSKCHLCQKEKSYHITFINKNTEWFLDNERIKSRFLSIAHKPHYKIIPVCSRQETTGSRLWSQIPGPKFWPPTYQYVTLSMIFNLSYKFFISMKYFRMESHKLFYLFSHPSLPCILCFGVSRLFAFSYHCTFAHAVSSA